MSNLRVSVAAGNFRRLAENLKDEEEVSNLFGPSAEM
jgi:hypothetical protein